MINKILLLLIVSAFIIYGDSPFYPLKPFNYSENGTQMKTNVNINRYAGLAFSDWDGDGDFDMFKTEPEDSRLIYIENTGTPQSHDFSSGQKIVSAGGVAINFPKKG